jgi:hypothetical protein
MKLSVVLTGLAAALAEAHCQSIRQRNPWMITRLTSPTRHLPQRRQHRRLAGRAPDDQLPEQRPRDGRQLGPDPVLRALPRPGGARHLQRHRRPDHLVQRQGLYLPPGPHGLLHRQGPCRLHRRQLGWQGRRVVQDLPGHAAHCGESDLAYQWYEILFYPSYLLFLQLPGSSH